MILPPTPEPRIIPPGEYLTEQSVYERWHGLFKPGELRRARRRREIGFYDFPSGFRVTPQDVQAYLDRKYRKDVTHCPVEMPQAEPGSNSPATTSSGPIPSEEGTGTPAGMTPELVKSAAALLGQQISKRPRSGSRRSSAPPPKPPRGVRPRLIKS